MNRVKAAAMAVLLVGGVAGLAFFGMRSGEAPKPVISTRQPPGPTSSLTPVAKTEQTYPCRIVPQQSVWASTPVTGPIEAVYVDVGQMVTDGQVLARVKSGTVTPTVAGMEKEASQDHAREVAARLAATKTEAKKLQADVLRARTAVARAEPVFRKQELLNNAGATPRLVFENARAEYQRAARELAAAEEASRQADNMASRASDELRQANETAQEKARASVAVASGIATAEIHAAAAGLVIERKIAVGDLVTDSNRAELFRIAVHPDLLRAEFEASAGFRTGQAISIRAGGVEIRAVMNDAGSAEFESHLGSVTMGMPCSAGVQIR